MQGIGGFRRAPLSGQMTARIIPINPAQLVREGERIFLEIEPALGGERQQAAAHAPAQQRSQEENFEL